MVAEAVGVRKTWGKLVRRVRDLRKRLETLFKCTFYVLLSVAVM